MAKKRVHELAKQYDMPSAEVMKRLNDYGLKVKASASAVDEHEAERALTGKPPRQESNGKPQTTKQRAPQQTGMGFDRPATETARQRLEERQQRAQAAQARAKEQAPKKERPQRQDGQRRDEGAQQQRPPQQDGGGGERRQRPTRSSLQGERAPGTAGGVRRVVIDSQASRRSPGGPGGPGGGPPGPQRRPPRRGGRRRRGTYEEPAAQDVSSLKADVIKVNSGSTVKDVAEYLGVPVPDVIKKLMSLGEMATLTQTLSDDAVQVLADEFDKEIELVHAADEAGDEPEFEDADEDLEPRPPVVTIMGHVDHGKTSLLDAIRETEVAAGEAGGITQHIGAYQVHQNDKTITFLDTPGHEAFTAMRARGAQATDIAVIVVAADDGVKPQTREAVDHAKAAEVPILVAVNKIDKEGAQPDRVRTEMTNLGLQPEEWGGETMFVDVSAKTHEGLDDLLEGVLLIAEVEELKANPDTEASGVVIESKLDPGRGAVVTVLVQRGTLRVGDALVAGAHWGRVRAMQDYTGKRVKQAEPSEPVEVLGFDSVPEAGEYVRVVENDRRARQLAGERATRLKLEQQARRGGRKVSLETIFDQYARAEVQELALVLKADVSGSLEAFEDEIAKLPQADVQVQVISSGVGGITESDVNLAAASDAVVIGFNVRPVGEAAQLADREGVEIRTYSVIYRAFEDLRDAMQGLLAPEEVEETVGQVEVRAIFKASRVGTIAGSYVTDGKVTRGAKVRLVRDGAVVYDGTIDSLRRGSDDVREVASGFECGIVLHNFADVKEGDQLEVYETRQVERTLS
ncbi:MAG TPA: translation initiation factor IF-2 [Solirubrobacteraceae bacterium]|nr:translation initiation factor IF-2 [Solirubrobacteraceae bacterium]